QLGPWSPVSPIIQILAESGQFRGFVRDPGLGSSHEGLFLPKGNVSTQNPRAQEYKIRIERIEHAIVIDFLNLPGQVQGMHLVPRDLHLARLAENLGKEVEAARQPASPIIRQPVEQIQLAVVAVSAVQEIVAGTATVAERGQFQERQVET